MRRLALSMVTIALVGCSGDGRDGDVEPDAEARASTVAKGGDGVSAAADSGSQGGRDVSLETELYEFAYSYPREAGERQGLRMVLDRRLEQAKTALIMQARAAKKDADGSDIEFRPHSAGTQWSTVASIPGWLSLEAEIYTYFGGAHPNYQFDSLVWSDEALKAFAPAELFASPAALAKALRPQFCKLLDGEREERRGTPVKKGSDDIFDKCIDPVEEATIVLLSSNGKAFDRIRVNVPPYAAGPYAEGSFEVELPVTKAVLDAVKPAHRNAFALYVPPKPAD